MNNNVVSITKHPKFRDTGALRRFLNGEDVSSVGDIGSSDWKMLHELQQWSQGLTSIGSEPVPVKSQVASFAPFKTIVIRNTVEYKRYEGPTDDA